MAEMENAIFTNMCMVYDGAGNILVQNRRNPNWPGITFPGGHVEHGESFSGSVIREVKEETGLDIQRPVLCGVKQFQTKEDARYVVLFYKTDRFSGMLRSSEEGDVFWIKRSELETYSLADDFEKMLEVFESSEIGEFYYSKCNGAWKAELL